MNQLAMPLNNAQIQILKLFYQPMNDKDLSDLNEILIDFLMEKLIRAADRFVDKHELSTEDVDNWRFEHNRLASVQAA